jgi:hypothetical protein
MGCLLDARYEQAPRILRTSAVLESRSQPFTGIAPALAATPRAPVAARNFFPIPTSSYSLTGPPTARYASIRRRQRRLQLIAGVRVRANTIGSHLLRTASDQRVEEDAEPPLSESGLKMPATEDLRLGRRKCEVGAHHCRRSLRLG